MAPEAQVIYEAKIAEIRSTGRFPSLLEFAVAKRDAKAAVAARAVHSAPGNDNVEDYLDRVLADLPFDFGDVPAIPAVTNLDGTPCEIEPVPAPDLVTTAPAPSSPPAPAPGASRVLDLVTKRPVRARARKRRSGLRQKEDAWRMRAHGRLVEKEVVEHLPPSPTPTDTETTTSTTKPENSARATTTITTGPTYRRGIASWEDAGELPRIISINRAVGVLGDPFAFSLNVDPSLIRAGNANVRGLLDFLRRRVALELKRATGRTPPMWLVIETDDDGRPHLHGGLALNDNDVPARIEKALAKAGGNWKRQGSAPADVRRQWEPDGWAVYPLKRMARTRRHLRQAAGLGPGACVTLYSATRDLLTEGKRIHDEERRRIGRA